MGNPLPMSAMLSEFRKTLDQFDIRFPASHSFISYQIACEAVQICASPDIPTFRRTLGISRSENGSVYEQISVRGESSPVSFRSKRHPFCGDTWGFLAVIYRFK